MTFLHFVIFLFKNDWVDKWMNVDTSVYPEVEKKTMTILIW